MTSVNEVESKLTPELMSVLVSNMIAAGIAAAELVAVRPGEPSDQREALAGYIVLAAKVLHVALPPAWHDEVQGRYYYNSRGGLVLAPSTGKPYSLSDYAKLSGKYDVLVQFMADMRKLSDIRLILDECRAQLRVAIN